MVKVSEEILNILCRPYGISGAQLKFLGGGRNDSEGIVYTYFSSYGKRAFKVLAVPNDKKEYFTAFKERCEFAKFLVEKGINITYPLLNNKGKTYEFFSHGEYTYIAYSMIFVEGRSPNLMEDLNDDLILEWGRITGKVHKASKKFKLWKNISSFKYKYGFVDEINNFYDKCRNKVVKEKFLEILKEMSKYPINRDTYGFIHNDNHENNILVNDKEINLIDFEFSSCQFFINDIIAPMQRIMFKEYGGLYTPFKNEKSLIHFLKVFIKGYREENYIDEVFIEGIKTFINYRRLVVYVSMESYLDKNAEIKEGFIEMIENPPDIKVQSF